MPWVAPHVESAELTTVVMETPAILVAICATAIAIQVALLLALEALILFKNTLAREIVMAVIMDAVHTFDPTHLIPLQLALLDVHN